MKLLDYINMRRSTEVDFTIKKFAKQCGCHQSTVTRIAKKKQMPSRRLAYKIEKATQGKVTFLELFCEIREVEIEQYPSDNT